MQKHMRWISIITLLFSLLFVGKMTGFAASFQPLDATNTVTYSAGEYTITYYLDGGTNNLANPNIYTTYSSTIYLLEPTKQDHSFEGWYNNAAFTGSIVTEIATGSTSNRSLYAKWSVNFTEELTFTPVGGSSSYTVSDASYSTNATNIVIPSTYNDAPVTSIADAGFRNNINIQKVTIEEGVVDMGNHVFRDCSSLSTITIPSTVTAISNHAFNGTSSLTALILRRSVVAHGSITSGATQMLSNTPASLKIFVPQDSINAYRTEPNWAIHSSKFVALETLFGDFAITPVTGGVAIYQYTGALNTVNIPAYINGQQVVQIGALAFTLNKTFTTVIVPSTVQSIGANAFSNSTNLVSVTLNRTEEQGITTAGTTIFANHNASLQIYTPIGSRNAYRTAANWSAYSAIIHEVS